MIRFGKYTLNLKSHSSYSTYKYFECIEKPAAVSSEEKNLDELLKSTLSIKADKSKWTSHSILSLFSGFEKAKNLNAFYQVLLEPRRSALLSFNQGKTFSDLVFNVILETQSFKHAFEFYELLKVNNALKYPAVKALFMKSWKECPEKIPEIFKSLRQFEFTITEVVLGIMLNYYDKMNLPEKMIELYESCRNSTPISSITFERYVSSILQKISNCKDIDYQQRNVKIMNSLLNQCFDQLQCGMALSSSTSNFLMFQTSSVVNCFEISQKLFNTLRSTQVPLQTKNQSNILSALVEISCRKLKFAELGSLLDGVKFDASDPYLSRSLLNGMKASLSFNEYYPLLWNFISHYELSFDSIFVERLAIQAIKADRLDLLHQIIMNPANVSLNSHSSLIKRLAEYLLDQKDFAKIESLFLSHQNNPFVKEAYYMTLIISDAKCKLSKMLENEADQHFLQKLLMKCVETDKRDVFYIIWSKVDGSSEALLRLKMIVDSRTGRLEKASVLLSTGQFTDLPLFFDVYLDCYLSKNEFHDSEILELADFINHRLKSSSDRLKQKLCLLFLKIDRIDMIENIVFDGMHPAVFDHLLLNSFETEQWKDLIMIPIKVKFIPSLAVIETCMSKWNYSNQQNKAYEIFNQFIELGMRPSSGIINQALRSLIAIPEIYSYDSLINLLQSHGAVLDEKLLVHFCNLLLENKDIENFEIFSSLVKPQSNLKYSLYIDIPSRFLHNEFKQAGASFLNLNSSDRTLAAAKILKFFSIFPIAEEEKANALEFINTVADDQNEVLTREVVELVISNLLKIDQLEAAFTWSFVFESSFGIIDSKLWNSILKSALDSTDLDISLSVMSSLVSYKQIVSFDNCILFQKVFQKGNITIPPEIKEFLESSYDLRIDDSSKDCADLEADSFHNVLEVGKEISYNQLLFLAKDIIGKGEKDRAIRLIDYMCFNGFLPCLELKSEFMNRFSVEESEFEDLISKHTF